MLRTLKLSSGLKLDKLCFLGMCHPDRRSGFNRALSDRLFPSAGVSWPLGSRLKAV